MGSDGIQGCRCYCMHFIRCSLFHSVALSAIVAKHWEDLGLGDDLMYNLTRRLTQGIHGGKNVCYDRR